MVIWYTDLSPLLNVPDQCVLQGPGNDLLPSGIEFGVGRVRDHAKGPCEIVSQVCLDHVDNFLRRQSRLQSRIGCMKIWEKALLVPAFPFLLLSFFCFIQTVNLIVANVTAGSQTHRNTGHLPLGSRWANWRFIRPSGCERDEILL